jgi:hypothetical protein
MAVVGFQRRFLQLCFYGVLPSVLLLIMLAGWMVSEERATVILEEATSPDGGDRTEVVREDPGVSSGYEYMVRVMPAGLTTLVKSLHVLPFAPIYVALNAYREPDKLTVRWSGSKEVTILCEGCGEITQGSEKWREIALKYELR